MEINTTNIISIILNFVLTGGLITLITLKSKKKEAEEKTETIELSNADTIVKMHIEYLVEPLKKEINTLRTEVTSLRATNSKQNDSMLVLSNKVALLTFAIEKINTCNYSANCPVAKTLNN